ncbi:hypothetical protein BH24ACT26_BH24ACT26_18790 [soil metagenome]
MTRRAHKRGRGARLLAVSLALSSVACTGADPSDTNDGAVRSGDPARGAGGTVAFGVVGSPATLDPYSPLASDLTRALVRPVYPSLYRLLPDGGTDPYLAASATRVGRRIEVTLRRARWSDGSRIGARDVVASARRARAPSVFAAFERVRALGPRTVAFRGRVERPHLALATAAFVLPRGEARAAVSGGPFLLSSHRPGLEVTYERNPDWLGERPLLDGLSVRFVQSLRQLVALLHRGRLEAAAPPSTVNIADVVGRRVRLREALGWETVYLDLAGFDLGSTERAAVVSSIDRSTMAATFVRSDGRVAASLPAVLGGTDASSDRAGDGFEDRIQVSAPVGDELLELVQRALWRQLRRAGIDADLVGIDPETFYGAWREDNPTDIALRRAAAAPAFGAPAARGESPAYPLFRVKTFIATLDGVHGPAPNPTLDGPLWNVESWWVEPG